MDNRETEVLIYEDTDYEDNPIRVYDGGGSWQSATFLAPEKKYELVFEYMRKFNLAFDLNAQIRKVLVIGGAGFAYPKYLIAHCPGVTVDVVDCDPTAY
ncbi:MAG: hypothetical protein IJI05_04035, partial [Erysipelotrichaceae bacterium]|nr:hypothetical protein [Erysipelotrichaceae bacterium]